MAFLDFMPFSIQKYGNLIDIRRGGLYNTELERLLLRFEHIQAYIQRQAFMLKYSVQSGTSLVIRSGAGKQARLNGKTT